MSYDFELQTPAGTTLYGTSCNYTSNAGPIFEKALGVWITDLNGKKAGSLYPIFTEAIQDMQKNMEEYRRLEPGNGWGDTAGVLDILIFYQTWFSKEPDMIFYVGS